MKTLHAAAASLSILAFAPGQSLVVPNAAAGVELNSSSGVPFNVTQSETVQFVIDTQHWAGISTPVVLQQLRFRADGAAGSWSGSTIASFQVDLSHAVVDHLSASPTPADNHGEDLLRAFDSPATVAAGSNAGGTPGPFYVTLPLATPFTYYPAWGRDLVVELTSSGLAANQGYRLDAETGALGVTRIHVGQVRQTAVVTEWSYVPASGAFAAFDASVVSGPAPLTVQFTDRSWTNAAGGVLGWSWDFDGDGVVDSTAQNPSFTYSGCGSFSPSLTVVDAAGSATRVRTNLIQLDALEAAFSLDNRQAAAGPLAVQFTDLSAGAPTSWAWDFDGDGVVDSTLQNPAHSFGPGYHDVTLSVTNGCGAATTTLAGAVVVRPGLPTILSGNNGIDPPGGVFFDVEVLRPDGLHVSGFDLHCREDAGHPFQVEVFVTSGSHVGKDGVPAVWRLAATGTAVSRGLYTPTFSDVSDFFLPQGRHGLSIYFPDARHRYSNAGGGTPSTFANADLRLTLGAARADRFSGTRYDNRVWNGAIYYEPQPGDVYTVFGEGCPNVGGHVASLGRTPGTELRLGRTFGARIGNLQPTQPAMLFILGFNNQFAAPGSLPLPVDLGAFGMTPGCNLRVEALDTFLIINTGRGFEDWTVPVPNQPNLLGLGLYNQVLVLDSAAGNRLGAVLSDAASGAVGL